MKFFLHSFFQPRLTLSHLDPNIFLRILLPYCLAQILSLFRDPNTDNHEINRGIYNSVYCNLADGVNDQQDRHCPYKRNTEARSRNQYCRGKARNMKYSEQVSVALLIQYATPMCHIIMSFVALLAFAYFPTLSHKRYNFRNDVIEHKCNMCENKMPTRCDR